MDTTRIESAMDTGRLRDSRVLVVGCGGSANLVMNLARCGVGAFTIADPDTVAAVNMVRQDYLPEDIGRPKVEALAETLVRINPDVAVTPLQADVTAVPETLWPGAFGNAHLLISTTDAFAAQATGNRIAQALGIPAVFPGIYRGGLGGEIAFWYPGLPCYRCLVPGRYAAHAEAAGRELDPPSDGTTIFDDGYVDAIAGMLAIGLLTRGGPGKYAEMVRRLGDRNFLQLSMHPDHRWNGRDVLREQLQVPPDNDRMFAWNAAARRDPDRGRPPCPDCLRHGHRAAG